MVNVEGDYTKLVSNKIVIKAPSIVFDSPSAEYTHKEEEGFWDEYFTVKSASFSFKDLDLSNNSTSVAFKLFAYNQTKYVLSKKEGRIAFTKTVEFTQAN